MAFCGRPGAEFATTGIKGCQALTARVLNRPVARLAALKAAAHRFSLAMFLVASVGLMMVGKIDTVLVEQMRAAVTDVVSPVLDGFSRPAATLANAIEDVNELTRLREENAALRRENEALQQYQALAHRLEAENGALRALMHYEPDPAHGFVTGRVIADNSGPFVRTIMVNRGSQHGLTEDQAALGARGLAGRVVQTGDRAARILLVTDLNSRIPVVVEPLRHRAILGGDNGPQPRLLYLPPESQVQVGDRVATSGHGGALPPGLPVGTVAAVEDGVVRVRLFEDLGRLEYVRLVDFEPYFQEVRLRSVVGHPR